MALVAVYSSVAMKGTKASVIHSPWAAAAVCASRRPSTVRSSTGKLASKYQLPRARPVTVRGLVTAWPGIGELTWIRASVVEIAALAGAADGGGAVGGMTRGAPHGPFGFGTLGCPWATHRPSSWHNQESSGELNRTTTTAATTVRRTRAGMTIGFFILASLLRHLHHAPRPQQARVGPNLSQ